MRWMLAHFRILDKPILLLHTDTTIHPRWKKKLLKKKRVENNTGSLTKASPLSVWKSNKTLGGKNILLQPNIVITAWWPIFILSYYKLVTAITLYTSGCSVTKCNKSIKENFLINLGTRTCLLCPLGQPQTLNCDKIPRLHSKYYNN